MNSFNHYAYGAVLDWLYEVATGISVNEETPGFENAVIAPHTSNKLDWLETSFETRHGKIYSAWRKQENMWRFEIETSIESCITIVHG